MGGRKHKGDPWRRRCRSNEIRRRAAQFVVDWRDEPGDERQQAQSFIRDLLRVFGITSTKAALYEKRAKRSSTGHRGYIDALVPGLCAIEMKSAGKDLEAAERQALDYIDDLTEVESPRWVITSDFTQFRVLDLQAPDGADTGPSPSKSCRQRPSLWRSWPATRPGAFGEPAAGGSLHQGRSDHGRPLRSASE